MSEWTDMAIDSLEAAKSLNDSGRIRSCLSRAYYSVYAAVTGELIGRYGPMGPYGSANPSHEQIATMAAHNLDPRRFSEGERAEIKRAIKRLLSMRIEADYGPDVDLDASDAVEGVRIASRVHRVIDERRRAQR